MAMQQLSLPGTLVKKSNQLVRSKIVIASVDASRILANLVACINSDDTEFNKVYNVAIKDFFPDTSGRGYLRAKTICKELLYAHAEIENISTGKEKLSLIPFFRQINYENGIVSAEFNSNMKPLLLELHRCFTEYNLLEYLALPSTYSQRLFEILKSWSGLPEVVISVSEMHEMLNTPMSFRSDFRNFRIRVLEKSHNDILSHTHLRFEWEPIKVGRSVEKIRFIFSEKRRALPEKEKEKAKEEKARRLANQRFIRAVECAKKKGGDCRVMDNVRIVCKLCQEKGICSSIK